MKLGKSALLPWNTRGKAWVKQHHVIRVRGRGDAGRRETETFNFESQTSSFFFFKKTFHIHQETE